MNLKKPQKLGSEISMNAIKNWVEIEGISLNRTSSFIETFCHAMGFYI